MSDISRHFVERWVLGLAQPEEGIAFATDALVGGAHGGALESLATWHAGPQEELESLIDIAIREAGAVPSMDVAAARIALGLLDSYRRGEIDVDACARRIGGLGFRLEPDSTLCARLGRLWALQEQHDTARTDAAEGRFDLARTDAVLRSDIDDLHGFLQRLLADRDTC